MRYRRIVDGEPQYGQNFQDFLQGIDAVAQAVATRLRLFTNEWWEDLDDGLPLWTQMLGYKPVDPENIGLIITSRILETSMDNEFFIYNMIDVDCDFNSETRKFTYTGTAVSRYGQILITNQI